VRRAAAVAAVVLAALALALVLARGGGDDDAYRVRAIFDNAGFVIPGYDVRVALGYSLVYPVAMIVKILLAQVLVTL